MAELVLDKVTKRFQDRQTEVLAVSELSLTVSDGELLVLVGPSGCGKSTALRMVAGLEQVTEGEIRIDERRVNESEPSERDIAMVFQNYALYPHMSVYRNIGYPLRIQGVPKDVMDKRIRETARILQLTAQLDRLPGQLSGGQRQRVAMGRALIREPKAFLMDEPLSNLDAKLRVYMRSEISSIQRQLGITTVYVTHDQVEAMTMGDRVAVMRSGVLQQVADPSDVFWHPSNMFVAAFIGSPPMNLFEGTVDHRPEGTQVSLGEHILEIASGHPATRALSEYNGKRVVVGIRPEHLRATSDTETTNVLRGRVEAIEQLGAESVCHFDVGLHRLSGGHEDEGLDDDLDDGPVVDLSRSLLVARLQTRHALEPNEKVTLAVDMDELRFFDPDSTNAVAY